MSNFLSVTFQDNHGLLLYSDASSESVNRIIQVLKSCGFSCDQKDVFYRLESNALASAVMTFEMSKLSLPSKMPVQVIEMSMVSSMLGFLAALGWNLVQNGVLCGPVKRNTLFFEKSSDKDPSTFLTAEFGSTIDSKGERYLLLPKSLNLKSVFSKTSESMFLRPKMTNKDSSESDFQTLETSRHVAVKLLKVSNLESRDDRIYKYLSIMRMLQKVGFKIQMIMSSESSNSDIIFFSTEDYGKSRVLSNPDDDTLWAMTLNNKFIDNIEEELQGDWDDPDVIHPERMYGIHTYDAPPNAKTTLIQSLLNSPGIKSGISPTKFWRPYGNHGKLAMVYILKALMSTGWHVGWTLNWDFSHSVLIFKRGPSHEATMCHLSAISSKKLYFQLVPRREAQAKSAPAKLLQSKLILDLKHHLSPFGAISKRGESVIRLEKQNPFKKFDANFAFYGPNPNALEILISAKKLLEDAGWRALTMADVTGPLHSHDKKHTAYCSSIFLVKDVMEPFIVPPMKDLNVYLYPSPKDVKTTSTKKAVKDVLI